MNRNSIICQCNADPTLFFYFSANKYHRKLGLYLIDDFTYGDIIKNKENTHKSKLSFTPATIETLDSIFSEETPIEYSSKFFPRFSWSKHSIFGAFTTGISREIKILSLNKGQLQISEKIDIPNYFCSCIDLNSNESFHLLASSNIKYCNLQNFTEGIISIIDINTKQNIVNFHKGSSFDRFNNILGYPNNLKWINFNSLVSGWKLSDYSSQLHFYDIRTKDTISVVNIMTNSNEFLSVNQPGGNYLLASNINNIISIFDIRFMKNEPRQNTIQTISCIYFNDNSINDIQWFPNGKLNVSICTKEGIFIAELNSEANSYLSFETAKANKSSENNDINWDEGLIKYFKPLNLKEDFSDTLCWVNYSGRSNIRNSLLFTTIESAYLISNLEIKMNSFPAFRASKLQSYSVDTKNKSQKNKVLNTPRLFGYSWIPYRIIKYYKNNNKRIEECNCIELLRRLENINSTEARNLVINQNDQNKLINNGVLPQAMHNLVIIIKIIKSASHAFNYLSTLPNQIIHWKDILKQFGRQECLLSGENLSILDKLILPSIRDLVYFLKLEAGNSDTSTQLKFINVKHEDLEGKPSSKGLNVRENFHHIEIFSSTFREKLINLFGVSSFNIETSVFINNNDPIQLESFLIAFFWNCVTLQYQNFISHGDQLSNILDNFIDNENKLLKTSFLKNIKLFFNSAGIFISNLYFSEELNKISLSRKDIQFYYYSIISTSEHLLDEDYYLPIWNSNIHLESTLQLSIRFIVTFSKFISIHEQSQQFSSYLLNELLIPSMGINSYIYIPANLLLLIGIYYLNMEEISNLIEAAIRKMTQNGFLDGISILGFNTFADEAYLLRSLPDHHNSEHNGTFLENINFTGNVDSIFLEPDNNINKNISYNLSSQACIKLIFQKYLSISFGDIQTVALIGSCIPNLTGGLKKNMELLKMCIDEYRNLLKNNSLIYYLINNSNMTNISRTGSKSAKFTYNVSSMLYELNILRSSYYKMIHIDQDKLRPPLPTGNTLFCYYCEQPLYQTCFEQSCLFEKSNSNSDSNLIISQSFNAELSEVQLEKKETIFKSIYNRDSQIGYSLRRTSNNTSSINNLIQPEVSQNLDLSSMALNCPNKYCKKPLPRCVVCLTEMSINMTSNSINDDAVQKDCTQQCNYNKLSKWYTWCLHCHHGGCFKHISEWFECFDECPVPECNCWCNSVDHWQKL
ncbi:conserved COOH terminal-specific cysteine rich domain [Cryptosporidium sp. chipmunk genotype I]|uniref:conserved COOH terminal-specific cysteine rich domain n=1 Tax=Cryptosporidium sp. chipmunk genotype I TaxID=1280935 RepID=UPI00351A3861|nr:conserved COOH terminal-specific cysteine rich domain [Cryptosporidium sp. chipmunk genotype I]